MRWPNIYKYWKCYWNSMVQLWLTKSVFTRFFFSEHFHCLWLLVQNVIFMFLILMVCFTTCLRKQSRWGTVIATSRRVRRNLETTELTSQPASHFLLFTVNEDNLLRCFFVWILNFVVFFVVVYLSSHSRFWFFLLRCPISQSLFVELNG